MPALPASAPAPRPGRAAAAALAAGRATVATLTVACAAVLTTATAARLAAQETAPRQDAGAAASGPAAADSAPPLLLRAPALSATRIAFTYGGDLWTVARAGGDAVRLTAGPGTETDAHFSPDGARLAFTGEYDGNVDAYVVPAAGGNPTRLTYHPGRDEVVGWTSDGSRIVFRSARAQPNGVPQLYTISPEGGMPQRVNLPTGYDAAFSPSGARVAYMPTVPAFAAWKRYRGGRTTPIWLARLADARVEKIPRENSNDVAPMWLGGRVYFLSDRNGPVTLFAYDTTTRQVTQAVANGGLDIKSAAAGPDAIVYEQFGAIRLFDPATGATRPVPIRVRGDLPAVRPRLAAVEPERIVNARLSPTGTRAVFEARGDIFTAPAKKGDVRDLTNTPGVAERDPAWSPDGRWIAYFSDAGGEYALELRDQSGRGAVRRIPLAPPAGFYYAPLWSPDSRRIAYLDNRLTLWVLDVASGRSTRVDADLYENPWLGLDPVWSPDSRWLAYTRELPSRLRAVFIWSPESRRAVQVTDGMSDARYAAFDRSGKYLYFTASTDAGPSAGWLDMSSFDRPVTRSVYLVVLPDDLPSPLAPESDEERVVDSLAAARSGARTTARGGTPPAADSAAPAPVRIDFAGISQRILALPIPPRAYAGLVAGKAGQFLLLEGTSVPVDVQAGEETPPPYVLHRFDLATRKLEKVVDSVAAGPNEDAAGALAVSADGRRMLYRSGKRWTIAPTAEAAKPGQGVLDLAGARLRVDPRAEWRQMYEEVWRIERDFFYDPALHGLDRVATAARYRPYVAGLSSRSDLTYLFEEMLGDLTVGHLFVRGGDAPRVPPVGGGLLGADYTVDGGRYRFARIYGGENWNPGLQAPLTQPGVNVRAGEYLLAVNGRELRAGDNLYALFEGTAGKQVVLTVARTAAGAEAREVTVVPVASEAALRNRAWVEGNRRMVDSLSGGRLAYVYLPNTAGAGYTNFNRYYFAQVGKRGVVLDERFNGGGTAADYIIDYLRRPLMNYWTTRYGRDFTTPAAAIFGPKVMITNEYAGSGGDALPWYFKESKLGPLVGTRTWGGLVGIYSYPVLMDGGTVTAPRVAFYNTRGEWDVENRGVAPDIEVEQDPASMRAGRDPQLERAVAVALSLLERTPAPVARKPAYPVYQRPAAAGGAARTP